MKPDTPTSSQSIDYVKNQCKENTPPGIIEQIANQMDIASEARLRIQKEGIVVRDMKGSVIQHPAIKIEYDAAKLIVDMLRKHRIINN